jgi:hypothetical protein
MSLAIVVYDVVLFVHVLAVVVAFGVTFTYPIFYAVAARAQGPQRAAIHRVQQRIGRTYLSFGLLVVVLAGAYLASDRDLWSEPWVSGPLVIAIVIGGVGGGFLSPRETRLVDLAGSGPEGEYRKVLGQARLASYSLSLLVLVAIFLMTTKPGG